MITQRDTISEPLLEGHLGVSIQPSLWAGYIGSTLLAGDKLPNEGDIVFRLAKVAAPEPYRVERDGFPKH